MDAFAVAIVTNWTTAFTLNTTAKSLLVYGSYEGYADQWQHVFTVAVSPPQDNIAVGCCPRLPTNSSLFPCASNVTSTTCETDRSLANVTTAGGNSSLYWMADSPADCVTVTNGPASSFVNATNTTIMAVTSCRKRIGITITYTNNNSLLRLFTLNSFCTQRT